MKRQYLKWYSPSLGRDMELLLFGHAGPPVIFFPTRTARFYDYENWKIIEALKSKIESGLLQVVCVDSTDAESFYSDAHPSYKIKRYLDYESYILYEVLPFAKRISSSSDVIVAGCSLGGYHAMNIAMKHPSEFSKVVSMSARYDLTLSSQCFPDLFNGYVDENIYYNMPSRYLPNLTDPKILSDIRKLNITIAVGKEDPFFYNNEHLSKTFLDKNIKHEWFHWDGEAHRSRYWRQMVKWYL
ncbi:esterase family protein [Ferruginibacter albus]|uniref:esterase family protein n=1 Tax=Ferruginibacter albus TaxID=2875540 RepID=UPI001CC742A1|nr:alpha/beta fold hydrolase [Ferruginibacter albus]UAY52723.1 esterase [Ferruginibacter albus]